MRTRDQILCSPRELGSEFVWVFVARNLHWNTHHELSADRLMPLKTALMSRCPARARSEDMS